ncbi:hypothetical protein PENSUB_11845 [Penicillium subrubescens]|uniref:Fungal-type protein kinase domain-containing protein n=1 Tax=Penicillium subrubescens TaxID=1316194 RepID=A0A1Q5T2V9_9EURO|nr:hypothetical protein PENSUB_11845 [Penicillium subrubescens]
MSSPYSARFFKGIDPGTIVTLDRPSPSWWKIIEKLNEHDHQVNVEENEESGFVSFASAKALCCDPKRRSKKAFMRIYKQVPHRKTEMWDIDSRGRQATTYPPRELTACIDLTQNGSSNTPKLFEYKIGTHDRSGLVLGGFIIWLVWEIVPRLRLGDGYGADTVWALESDEMEQIRVAFVKALPFLVGEFYEWKPKRPFRS